MSQLLESISLVVGTPAESSLLFPIFIAVSSSWPLSASFLPQADRSLSRVPSSNQQGVDSTMERDRRTVKGFFDTIDAKFVPLFLFSFSFLFQSLADRSLSPASFYASAVESETSKRPTLSSRKSGSGTRLGRSGCRGLKCQGRKGGTFRSLDRTKGGRKGKEGNRCIVSRL